MCLTFCLVLIGLVMKFVKLRTSKTTFSAQKIQNRRPNSKRPGTSFYACKIMAPQGASTRIITVVYARELDSGLAVLGTVCDMQLHPQL